MIPMKAFCVIFFSCVIFVTMAQENLNYLEQSAGLQYPDFDGGRTELEFADINLDGYLDLVTIGDHGNPITAQHGIIVWLGSASGDWTLKMTGDLGYGGIAVGDANLDGIPDVGYGMHHNYSSTDLGDQLIEVALGDGSAESWIPWDDGLATAGETWGMFGTDFADIDNDGDLDIGSISFGSGAGVHVYRNQMDGTWEHAFGFLNGNSDMVFEFGDINRDGYADFVASHEYGSVYFGDGTGNFTLTENGLPAQGWAGRMGPSLGDVDNDGGMDLAYVTDAGGVRVYVWDEGAMQWSDFSGTLPVSGDYELTQLADMDSDGMVDVAAFGDGVVRIWLGDGTGTWTEAAMVTTPSPGNAQAFRAGGDVDHNGFPDFVIISEEGTWINYKNHLHFYKETSGATTLSISNLFPGGGEVFYRHSVQFIRWITSVPGGSGSLVRLEYSTTGTNGPWTLIADSLPDNMRFQWQVPAVNSANCFIRMTVFNDTESQVSINPSAFTITDGTVGISQENEKNTLEVKVFPNPFRDVVYIEFMVDSEAEVSLSVSDQMGRAVKSVLPQTTLIKGTHRFEWDGTDDAGKKLSPGIYSYRLIINGEAIGGRLVLIR